MSTDPKENDNIPPIGTSKNSSNESREIEPIDKYSALVIRGAIVGTGILGVATFFYNSRLFATYRYVQQIPQDFYRLGIQMKGIVREVDSGGGIRLEHRPMVKLPKWLRFRRSSTTEADWLNLRLAGLEVSPVGAEYLREELKLVGRPVLFSVINTSERQPNVADADVKTKRLFRHTNLSVELVRKGFARVHGLDNSEHVKALQFNSNYSRLITGLLTCEKIAERRGLGVWQRSTWVERLASYPSTMIQIVKQSAVVKLSVLAYWLVYDVCSTILAFIKQIFYIAQAFGMYSAEAYRRFANSVDRLNRWYLGLRRGGRQKEMGQK